MPVDFHRLTLTDTGPIVAMLDSNDKNHDRCWDAMRNLPQDGIVTPTACLVEILYLIGKAGGLPLQRKLWAMTTSGILQLRTETMTECMKAGQLMDKYSDVPMDFADAIMVVAADALHASSVFTLDRHFYAYRRSDGGAFAVIPG